MVYGDKAFNIAKNPKMMDIKKVLLHWFIIFNKNTSGRSIKSEIIPNQKLAKELHQLLDNLKSEKYTHLL